MSQIKDGLFRAGNGSSYTEQQMITKAAEDNEGPWKHRYQCGGWVGEGWLGKIQRNRNANYSHPLQLPVNFYNFSFIYPTLALPSVCPHLSSVPSFTPVPPSAPHHYKLFSTLKHLVSGLLFLSLATAHFSFLSALHKIITILFCISNKKVKPDKQNWYPATVLKYICPLMEWTDLLKMCDTIWAIPNSITRKYLLLSENLSKSFNIFQARKKQSQTFFPLFIMRNSNPFGWSRKMLRWSIWGSDGCSQRAKMYRQRS